MNAIVTGAVGCTGSRLADRLVRHASRLQAHPGVTPPDDPPLALPRLRGACRQGAAA